MIRLRPVLSALALLLPLGAQAGGGEDARPVDPACAAYGPGFAPVPGTRTCVHVGGQVRAEARRGGSSTGSTGLGGEVQVQMDARTDTEVGPMRTVVRGRFSRPER